MLHLELIYEWMWDMSSRVHAINNNKSIVRFRWFVIILQDCTFFKEKYINNKLVELNEADVNYQWN